MAKSLAEVTTIDPFPRQQVPPRKVVALAGPRPDKIEYRKIRKKQHDQGKKKHININKFAGLSRDWGGGGAKNVFMCVCVFFLRVIPFGGENT